MDKKDYRASGSLPENDLLYAPGLKWRVRSDGEVPYWFPPSKDMKAGYIPKSRTLDPRDSDADIAAECRAQWADLLQWRANKDGGKITCYTVGWLIDRYENDPMSPIHKLMPDTKQSYGWECARIRQTVGERRIDPRDDGGPRIVGEDLRRWHYNWGHPEGKEPTPSRARHCMAMLRTLLSYNVEIGTPGAEDLRGRLSAMKFEGATSRTKAPTYEQVDAIVTKALESGYRSIAITTLAQYELIERRAHIIGQWNGETWARGWVWDGQIQLAGRVEWVGVTPDWRILYYQTKKGANLREYDLKAVQRLMGLMQETPKEARTGAIIVCEDTGQPWIKRRYQKAFREIARAAGVPDDVWSMDMRSGGATETDSIAEVTDRMFDDAGGWADSKMKNRYRRNKQRNANTVVELRQAAREKK